jgi:hypothetical protein
MKRPFLEHTPEGDPTFGVACLAREGFLYVYGVREDWTQGVEGRSLLVGRVPLEWVETCAVNSWNLKDHQTDLRLCGPRLVRVDHK